MNFTAALFSPQQAHSVLTALFQQIKPLLMAGHRLELEVHPEAQSRDQQELYHAVIGEIAKQAKHLGAKWDRDDWKRLLINKFAKETGRKQGRIIPALDGDGVVEVGVLSRHFSKQTASEFIEWLYAWCATNGVEISPATEPA